MPRLARVSLQDVPLDVRERAARPILKRLAEDGGLSSLRQSVEVERAVISPSPHRYRVPADAVERVLGQR